MAKRKIHIGGKEVLVGLAYAVGVYLFERYQLREHPDVKATALHLAEPIAVPLIVAVLAGVSLSAAWAAFKRLGHAAWFLIKWMTISGVLIALFVIIAKGSLVAAVVLAFIGANIIVAIASVAVLAKGVGDFDPTTTPDPEKPWETETYGIPGIDPKQLPPGGFGEVPPSDDPSRNPS
ncbi:MAG TPA: hypothetical protein VGM65_16580 [Candidatus Udaeobacter sp.]